MSGRIVSRREVVLGGIAGLVFPDWPAGRAAPITLPDPHATPPAIIRQNPASPVLLLSPLEARTTATLATDQVSQIANKAVTAFKQVKAVEQAVQQNDDQIKDLENRKRTALMELRRGDYCSKCGDTRIEVERKHKVRFEVHLTTVGAKGIPGSPDQIAKKAAEYDAQIEPLQRNQQQRRDNAQKIRSHISDLQHQIHEGIALWRAASITERALTAAREEEARRVDQKELSAARDRLVGLITEAANLAGDPETAKSSRALQNERERQTLRSVIASVESRARARQTEYWREVDEAQSRTETQERELIRAARAFVDGGDFRPSQIPTFNVEIKSWSMNMSENQAGAKFQATKILSMGIEAKLDRDAQSMEVKSFLELFGKAKIYGGLLTENGGTKLTPIVGLDLPEPDLKLKGKLKLQPPPTDDWKVPQPGDWKNKLPFP